MEKEYCKCPYCERLEDYNLVNNNEPECQCQYCAEERSCETAYKCDIKDDEDEAVTNEDLEKVIAELYEEIKEELEQEEEPLEFVMSLYLYDFVSDISVQNVIEGIRKANNPLEVTYYEAITPDPSGQFICRNYSKIVLNINSGGGDVDAGTALINEILASEIPVECRITNAHSMAFSIALACDKRSIFKLGKMMHHDVYLGIQGKYESVADSLDMIKRERDAGDAFILGRTDLTKEFLDKIYREKLDYYFTPEEALEYGIVNEII